MLTVFLIVFGVMAVVLAPFVPGWVTTTQDSFQAMAQQKELNDASIGPVGAMVPSQIAPWMATQARTMSAAEGPLEWKVVSFRGGPCDPGNLSQLPPSKYSDAIVQACVSFDDVQLRYSGTCFLASNCDVPEVARIELTEIMDEVWYAFSDAGFVLPYTDIEQQVLP
ncbi:MAG: hypothetical protein QF357_01545 [Dehalococcoidia bacterium]|jgi:hypothetical protein|nr:hypothetical protein [Dehalococcoidia bacterium]